MTTTCAILLFLQVDNESSDFDLPVDEDKSMVLFYKHRTERERERDYTVKKIFIKK
jgi:hypothetical protein